MSMADDQNRPAVTILTRRNVQREVGDTDADWCDVQFDETSNYYDNENSTARTTFFHWDDEIDGGNRQKWKNLSELNYGKRKSDSSSRDWQAGKINDAFLFCDHLDFDENQTETVVDMAKEIELDKFGNYTAEQVLVAGCSLVADRHTDNFEDRIIATEEYKDLMEAVHLGSKEYRNIRNAIRERTDFF